MSDKIHALMENTVRFNLDTSGSANKLQLYSDASSPAVKVAEVELPSVAKAVVTLPEVTNLSFTYDRTEHGPTITGFSDATMTKTGTERATAAGADYKITISLKDPGGYQWSDGTNTAKEFTWSIAKKNVTITGLSAANKTYDGSTTATVQGTATVNGKISGDTVNVSAGSAAFESKTAGTGKPVKFSGYALTGADAANYNLTSQPANVTANISQKSVTITGLSASNKVYDGNTSATVTGTATVSGKITGDTVNVSNGSANFADKNAGNGKTVTFSSYSLTGADSGNYTLSAQPTSVTANITKKDVTVSGITASNKVYDGSTTATLVYTNAAFSGKITGDTLTVTATGKFSSADVANNKTVTITNLTLGGSSAANYQLASSGQQSSTTANITQATGSVTLSKTSTTIKKNDSTTDTVTVNKNGSTGNLSVSSNKTNIATASVSGTTVTITGVAAGTAEITVTMAATTNYSSATAKIAVTVEDLKIVTFADGTDAEIKAMLDAHYAGTIDIAEHWAVGNTRKISLNSVTAPNGSSGTWAAQDITIVITAIKHHDLATAINGKTKAAITVQTRECLNNNSQGYNQAGHIYVNGDNQYDMTFSKWSNLYMRTWLNGAFKDTMLPTAIKNMIKPIKHNMLSTNGINPMNTQNSSDGSKTDRTVEQVTDSVFLPTYPEVYGNVKYDWYLGGSTPNSEEGTQWEYYKTASNRIKNGNNNGASNGVAQYWWEGSPSSYWGSSAGYRWCRVHTYGNAGNDSGNRAHGLAPAFSL